MGFGYCVGVVGIAGASRVDDGLEFSGLEPRGPEDVVPDVHRVAAELDVPGIQTDAVHEIAGIGLGQEFGQDFREVTQGQTSSTFSELAQIRFSANPLRIALIWMPSLRNKTRFLSEPGSVK